jgi:hypothetical protein
MDKQQILTSAMQWMNPRGWRNKLAKSRSGQSLFEHSLVEVDVLLELQPILAEARHYGLTEAEGNILTVAALVHDTGKETDEWQKYVQTSSPTRWVSHVIPELVRGLVPEVCKALGFDDIAEGVQRTMAHCAEFHHTPPGRGDGAVMEALLLGGTDRFLTLAYLVKAVDHLCSADSPRDALHVGENDPSLGKHVRFTTHEASPRGVSTAFVHRAAQRAFESLSWKPLLYFTNGTVYGKDMNDTPTLPPADEIVQRLSNDLSVSLGRDVSRLMVGSPTGNILPKPDLFSFAESRNYLQIAFRKIGPQSFAKKQMKDKRTVVLNYWKLTARDGHAEDAALEHEVGRISAAQPEMLVFKFFKAMMDPGKISAIGTSGARLAEKLYEQRFGVGSWEALQGTSTLMPARDMAGTVDYFWRLSGPAVAHPEVESVEELAPDIRAEVLIDLLNGIVQKVYAAAGCSSPRDGLARSMSEAFIRDLLNPATNPDVRTVAASQLLHYSASKAVSGTESAQGLYLCPICNASFKREQGKTASADFIDNPQAHTNRGVSHGRFGYIVVCLGCYYERLLRQVLMGDRPAEIIRLEPRLNCGPRKGEKITRDVRSLVEAAQGEMRGESGDLERGFSLGFTDQAARAIGDRDPFALAPGELLALFRYRFTAETQKKRRREAMKRLKAEFDEDLAALNASFGESFGTWEAAVQALIENRMSDPEIRAIRREVFRLYETVQLVCETPNVIFIPMSHEIAGGDKESETSRALRRLYVALLLGMVFDSAVAIDRGSEAAPAQGNRGAAYVPPVPAVRALIRYDWLPVTEAKRWLMAIGAASRLVRATGLPERSALYQILAADPAERVARRIEEQNEMRLSLSHVRLISQLPYFRSAPN